MFGARSVMLGAAVSVVLAGGTVVSAAHAAPAVAVPMAPAASSCSVNFFVEQDTTYSYTHAEFQGALQQDAAVVKQLSGHAVPVTAGFSDFGQWAPLDPAHPVSGNVTDPAAAQAMADHILSTTRNGGDNGTNWEAGLKDALNRAKAQGATTIAFVTDGVPNTWTDPSDPDAKAPGTNGPTDPGGWVQPGTAMQQTAIDRAAAVATQIRAAGINLVPIFVKTSAPNLHGINDPIAPASSADIERAMSALQPGWRVSQAISISDLGAKILANATESCSPSITLKKSHASVVDTNHNGISDVGDTVVFKFDGANTGDLPLTNVKVTDPKLAAAGVKLQNDGVIGDLAIGASYHLESAPYTLTQADVDAGLFENVATVNGDSAKEPVTATSTDKVPADQLPKIAITKSADSVVDANKDGLVGDVGDTVVWRVNVSNPGNTTWTKGVVTDELLAKAGVKLNAPAGWDGTLAPGATAKFTSEPYTLTAADVSAGKAVNVARIDAVGPKGEPLTATADAEAPTKAAAPGLGLVKTADAVVDANRNGVVGDAGDTTVWHVTAKNTGNVALSQAVVSDKLLADAKVKLNAPAGWKGTLAPGASVTFKSEPYTLTPADVAAGKAHNVATATAKDPYGKPVKATADAEVPTKTLPDPKPITGNQVSQTDPAGISPLLVSGVGVLGLAAVGSVLLVVRKRRGAKS